ncbi:MAG: protein kinase [Lentisphaeria bacterium]|nr:protein kinase [Lentisphaeria bacterium]
MSLIQCEFCKRPYDPKAVSASGRHPCCGVRPAGEMTGKIEGTCRIIGELGKGATGTVYLAQQLRLQRTAALKLMTNSTLDDEASARLFFSEVRAAGKLIHPNIARIYTAGETDRQCPYSVMEYVEGRTLEEHLSKRKTFPAEEVRKIAMAIADALNYAWRTANLTHGDLKPANIMLRKEDNSVSILDLGLQAARQENHVDTAIGTPLYAAPELVNTTFGETDFHADIYSLGIMMYEMLTGAAPFDGTPAEILQQHQTENAPPVHQKVPEVPPAMSRLICRMLQRYVPDRPSWPEVLRTLQVIQEPQKTSETQHLAAAEQTAGPHMGRILALMILAILLSGLSGYTLARKISPAPIRQKQIAQPVSDWQKKQAFRCAELGQTAELEDMLQNHFPVDTENEQGNSLLMQAAYFQNPDTVRMILQYSPDIRHRNRLGENVFDIARVFPEIEKLLKDYSGQ